MSQQSDATEWVPCAGLGYVHNCINKRLVVRPEIAVAVYRIIGAAIPFNSTLASKSTCLTNFRILPLRQMYQRDYNTIANCKQLNEDINHTWNTSISYMQMRKKTIYKKHLILLSTHRLTLFQHWPHVAQHGAYHIVHHITHNVAHHTASHCCRSIGLESSSLPIYQQSPN